MEQNGNQWARRTNDIFKIRWHANLKEVSQPFLKLRRIIFSATDQKREEHDEAKNPVGKY